MSDNKIILVTGGAGFIGSNAARFLANHGWRVVVSDALGTDEKWRNLNGIALEDIIHPDESLNWISRYHKDLGTIIHMGAISATTERDVDSIIKNNIRLSLDLWSLCAENEISLIYASSAATYGDGSLGFRDSEEFSELTKLRALNAYGWSKWFVDRKFVAEAQGGRCPPQWAGLRFFNVYGPYEDHKGDMRSVINKIYPTVLGGAPVSLFKSYNSKFDDGEQKRDFVYVADCVSVITWFLENAHISGIFNLGTGEARSFNDLAAAVFSAAKRVPEIQYVDMPPQLRPKYQYFTQADMTKLHRAGYTQPFTALEDGVHDYINSYLAKRED